MTRVRGLLLGVLLVAWCLPATGESTDNRFGIGLRAGTYGIGGDFGVRIIDRVGIRASVQRLSVSVDEEEIDEIVYDGDLDIGGEGLLVDVYPMRGKFRLTAGVFNNRNEVGLEGIVTENIEIGDTTYTPDDVGTLTGSVEFDDTAPYFGIGWGNVASGKGRIGLLVDLGILMQDVGQVGLESSTGFVDPDDLAQEIAEIEDDISDFDFWPVLSVGMSIRF
ncbi:MAG: hypothetical protein GY716_21375 [bacterium]|nr:hypothetical protein [bacterium]